MTALFQTQRQRVLEAYKAAGEPFDAGTKPYKSTLPIRFDVAQSHPAAAPTMSHLIARVTTNQNLAYFGYGLGESISNGLGGQRNSDESDTNLSKGKSTNGSEDYIIEAISLARKGVRIAYAAAAFGAEVVTDPDVLASYQGTTPMVDPGSLAMPPQIMAPFNLEDVLFEAIKPHMQFTFEFDRRQIEEMGTWDEVPEGGAKSQLRASGDPRTDNRWRVPEGFIWRKEGQPDSEFVVRARLKQAVVIPVSLITGLLGLSPAARPIPTGVALDITMRVHGLSVAPPTKN